MNQPNRIAGIVKKVGDEGITLSMENGGEMIFPKNFGESPKEGEVLIADSLNGSPVLYSMPPVTRVGTIKRYMNFYAIEQEGNTPDVTVQDKEMSIANNDDSNSKGKNASSNKDNGIPIAPFSPFSFADMPAGARTLTAGNGNMCFAGPTSAGIVTSCESKVIVRDDGTAEMATPHFRAMLGKTIIVSSLHDNVSVEIDINNTESSGGVHDINDIKNSIAKRVTGKYPADPAKASAKCSAKGSTKGSAKGSAKCLGKYEPAMSYEEAFIKSIDGSELQPFYNLFGLQLAEVLLTFQWERIKYHGSEKTFNEVFGGITVFESVYLYCQDCFGKDVVGELELFIHPGMDDDKSVTVSFPSCEQNVYDTVMGINAYINGDQYRIYALKMTMKDGTIIEYSKKKRIYALSHGVIAKDSWNSAKRHALYSDNFYADIDVVAIPDLTFSSKASTYCGRRVGTSSITWDGDFNFNVLGNSSFSASKANTIYGGKNAVIGGGTRGIYIDNDGSSAITI